MLLVDLTAIGLDNLTLAQCDAYFNFSYSSIKKSIERKILTNIIESSSIKRNIDKKILANIDSNISIKKDIVKKILTNVDSNISIKRSILKKILTNIIESSSIKRNIDKKILANIYSNISIKKDIVKKILTNVDSNISIKRSIEKELAISGITIESNFTKYNWISKFFNNLIPKFYQKLSNSEENTLLKNFLNIFEFVHDDLKNDIIHFKTLIDIDNLEYKYLPYLAYLLGLEFDFNTPDNVIRNEIKNAWQFYKYKGTTDGVSSYVRLSTNLQNIITVNTNTMTLDIYVLIENHIDEILYNRIINSTDKFIPILWNTVFHRLKVDSEEFLSSDSNEMDSYTFIIAQDILFSEYNIVEKEIRSEIAMDSNSENLSLNLLSLTVNSNDYLLDDWFLTNNFEILND
jgi:phage tail-like protein